MNGVSREQSVKQEFAKIFEDKDAVLFKKMAESYLRQAAELRKKDFVNAPSNLKLLFRNCEKRLFIGVAIELLLKAIYLSRGYCINRASGNSPDWPYTIVQLKKCGIMPDPNQTWQLNDLIQQLDDSIVALGDDKEEVVEGLKIAKVFRNKEGHIVTATHQYNSEDYRAVERALILLYKHAFKEKLSLRFSIAPGEKSAFKLNQEKK
jgi:hypothetical protein